MLKTYTHNTTEVVRFIKNNIYPAINNATEKGLSSVRVFAHDDSYNNIHAYVQEVKLRMKELGYNVSYISRDWLTDCQFEISW